MTIPFEVVPKGILWDSYFCGTALLRVKGLKRGKSAARETDRVRPPEPDSIQAAMKVMSSVIRTMVEIQLLCEGRPQDVVQMRSAEIDRSGEVWEYRPRRHKTEHHEGDDPDRERVIYLGPRSQAILHPFLEEDPEAYFFSPARAEAPRNRIRRLNRKSPLTPSQSGRKSKGRARGEFGDHYSVASYRQAIRRACVKAGVPIWVPNQLRHARLTEIRKLFGLEASRVVGGHREVGVTQVYAEQDRDLVQILPRSLPNGFGHE
jgi:integrase